MSHPKNSNKRPAAQEQKLDAYECELSNSSQNLFEAGSFVWALGSLIRKIHEHDKADELLTEVVVDGLAAGLMIVGSKLSDDGLACRDLLRHNGAIAQGGVQ